MKQGFVKTSTHFFRLIKLAMLLFAVSMLFLAAFIPAPLQEAANPALTPNPVKSAWFLLWIQELVSYSRFMIYPVLALGSLFLLLPWLPGTVHLHRARWFAREQRVVNLLTIVICCGILALTMIALYLRGANWSLTLHL
jgi:hypothetical protein